MKKIKLTQGKYALVDDEDFEHLNQWKWCFTAAGGYAIRSQHIGYFSGKRKVKRIWMHRVINKTPAGLDTDHVNGNGVDNRKNNLRSATRSQNHMNRKSRPGSVSKYKGVYLDKRFGNWVAQIRLNNKSTHIGSFKTEAAAAKAYNKEALKHFGSFAKLNGVK